MGENNSVPFALELLQLLCKINTSSPWAAKVYAGAYHRLIWRFLGRITNDAIVGRLYSELTQTPYSSAALIASIGASRSNQMENESAP